MGKVVVRLIEESEDFELAASIDSKTSLDAALGADLIFDVTVPAVSQQVVEFAIVNGISVVVGTSGWSSERIATLAIAVEANPDLAVLHHSELLDRVCARDLLCGPRRTILRFDRDRRGARRLESRFAVGHGHPNGGTHRRSARQSWTCRRPAPRSEGARTADRERCPSTACVCRASVLARRSCSAVVASCCGSSTRP